MSAAEVAQRIVAGVKAGEPYVMTHPEFKATAEVYKAALLAGYGDGQTNEPGRRTAGLETEALMRALVGST
jgi:hypothetical protein